MRKVVKVLCSATLAFAAFLGWYAIAANYDYAAVAGEYRFSRSGAITTLFLNRDKTFLQILSADGQRNSVHGTWRRVGEAGVVFSSAFLHVAGERREENGEVYAVVRKRFLNLIPYIDVECNSCSQTYTRVLLNFGAKEKR